MIREISIRTPENIIFTYRLAGLASRGLAVLADTILLGFAVGLILGVAQLVMLLGGGSGITGFLASGVLAAALALGLAFVLGYFILFEGLWNGQTPGKRLLGIRVVRDRGEGLRLIDSALRNLLRIADLVPGLYAVAALSALLSSRNKRLGDYAAGTIVIATDRARPPERDGSSEPLRFNSLADDTRVVAKVRREVGSGQAALIRDVLERSATNRRARIEAASELASRYRSVLDLSAEKYGFLGDEALLRDIIDILDR